MSNEGFYNASAKNTRFVCLAKEHGCGKLDEKEFSRKDECEDPVSIIDPNLPLIDLHRHLDGSIRLETILELAKKFQLDIPANSVEELRPLVQVTDPQPGVMVFIEKFYWMTHVLVDYDACRRVAYENIEDAAKEGLDYVELRFSPWFMAAANALDPAGVVEVICDGIEAGSKDFGLPVKLIGIISRTYGPEIGMKELGSLLSQRGRIAALDLAGDELNYPARLFERHFQIARENGFEVTTHAGESDRASSIWDAIRLLGAKRIGHGVTAIEDPPLIDFLHDNQIAIECNLTSNVQTSTVTDYQSHPLRQFVEAGLLATINTDDPGISNIDLKYEYEIAAPLAGLSPEQIRLLQRNALKAAFLSEAEREMIVQRLPHKNI